jgi:hypothetical protein
VQPRLGYEWTSLRGPIARLDAVLVAADTGIIDNLTKAMTAASTEINEALKK